MTNIRIDHEITIEQLEQMIVGNKLLRYGANTCWWGLDDAPWYNNNGLPCDPRGGMLFQTEKATEFIEAAKNNIEHYGKYGLRCFLLAYHGCVVTNDGRPTCFRLWSEYEELIDALENNNDRSN